MSARAGVFRASGSWLSKRRLGVWLRRVGALGQAFLGSLHADCPRPPSGSAELSSLPPGGFGVEAGQQRWPRRRIVNSRAHSQRDRRFYGLGSGLTGRGASGQSGERAVGRGTPRPCPAPSRCANSYVKATTHDIECTNAEDGLLMANGRAVRRAARNFMSLCYSLLIMRLERWLPLFSNLTTHRPLLCNMDGP